MISGLYIAQAGTRHAHIRDRCCLAYGGLSCSQIIGRGNDQVTITSKFETREDIGVLPMGVVCLGLRGEAY